MDPVGGGLDAYGRKGKINKSGASRRRKGEKKSIEIPGKRPLRILQKKGFKEFQWRCSKDKNKEP